MSSSCSLNLLGFWFKLGRQKSTREKTENSTNSLPWEQIIDLKVVNFNDSISRKK